MTRLLAALAGILLTLSLAWTVAAQTSPQSAATLTQTIPVTASVPVTLDDGSVQTVTVPLTVTLGIDISVDGAADIGAEVAAPTAAQPIADAVTLENAGDFLPALADMPAGFKLDDDGPGSDNADLAASWPDPDEALAQFDDLGRLGSHYRDFSVAGLALFGNATLETSLVLFDNPQGAADAIALYRQRDEAGVQDGDYDSIQFVSMPPIGETGEATIRTKAPTGEGKMDGYSLTQIAFQKGNALVFVQARSFPNTGDFQQMIDIARLIEGRLP